MAETPRSPRPAPAAKRRSRLLAIIGLVVGALIGVLLVLFEVNRHPSGSMHPTIPLGARIVSFRFGGRVALGDLIVFEYPQDPSKLFVKRIVGVGGDTVPFRRSDNAGAGRAVFGQDPALLGPLVDVVSPMAYHLMLGKPPAWIGELVTSIGADSGRRVLPVVQACSIPGRLSDEDFVAAARIAARAPSAGVIVFSQRHLIRERRAEAWRRAFGETR